VLDEEINYKTRLISEIIHIKKSKKWSKFTKWYWTFWL